MVDDAMNTTHGDGNQQKAALNTDRELWRERDGDYYADSIHVTERGGIGINCGGHVFVMPLRQWHALAMNATSGDGLTTGADSAGSNAPRTVNSEARDLKSTPFTASAEVISQPCRVCGGSGFVAQKQFIDDGYGEVDSCPKCDGAGTHAAQGEQQ